MKIDEDVAEDAEGGLGSGPDEQVQGEFLTALRKGAEVTNSPLETLKWIKSAGIASLAVSCWEDWGDLKVVLEGNGTRVLFGRERKRTSELVVVKVPSRNFPDSRVVRRPA